MNTTIGAGRNSVRDFAIDFTDKDTYIGGHSFPKGYFAVAVLNYGKETITKLLYAGAECNQAMANMMHYSFRTDRFDALADAVFTIQHTLSELEPFCYLDVLAEEDVLRDLFSEEAKQLLAGHYALLDRHADCGDLAQIHLTEDEKLQGKAGVVAERKIFEILRSYNYFCADIANFATAILNLEAMKLRDLKKRDEAHFANACDEFFSDPEIREALYVLQPSHGMAGFSLSPDTRMEIIVVPNPKNKGEKMFARRLHFRRIMDFLVTDFFEGLHAGHSPRQCRNCGRYFHMTSARHQIYCDGIAPNDPDGRSCRTFAARSHRLEREKSTDHPALAMHRTRLNTMLNNLQNPTEEYIKRFGCTRKTAEKFMRAARTIRNRKEYLITDENGDVVNEAGEDHFWNYAEVLQKRVHVSAVRKAFFQLTTEEQYYLEARNAICMTCGKVEPLRKRKTFDQIGDTFEFTTANGAEKAYHRAVDRLAWILAADNVIRIVTVRQKEVTRKKKKIAAATYEYQADCDGEWGEIQFDFEAGTTEIVRLADWDTTISNVYARKAIEIILASDKTQPPKEMTEAFGRD